MRILVSLAVLTALGYTAYEFYQKYQRAQLATPAGLQAIEKAVNDAVVSSPRPFPSLGPVLVG